MGLEPTTSAVTGRRSNQLSHRALITPSKLYTAYLPDIFLSYDASRSAFASHSWSSPRPISNSQHHVLPHYHLVAADTPQRLDMIQEKLQEAGFLAPLQPWEQGQ